MKYEHVRFFLLGGWAVFLAVVTLAIWLGKPGHRLYLSARELKVNHRITPQDLIPSPGEDTTPAGRYVRGSRICKWVPVLQQNLAAYPTVQIPSNQVPVQLDLLPKMNDAVNEGSRLDVWDRNNRTKLLDNVTVLAITCELKACKAIVSAEAPKAQNMQQIPPANIEILIRSY
jgi:hypothetical protein